MTKKDTKVKVETKVETKNESTLSAVVILKGNQVFVEEGKTYEVKKIAAEIGDKVEADEVLLVIDGEKATVGKPSVKGAKVTFEVLSHNKAEKVVVFKYKAKARYRRAYGSRAILTKVLVKKIEIS